MVSSSSLEMVDKYCPQTHPQILSTKSFQTKDLTPFSKQHHPVPITGTTNNPLLYTGSCFAKPYKNYHVLPDLYYSGLVSHNPIVLA
jgi:hypothetical protein